MAGEIIQSQVKDLAITNSKIFTNNIDPFTKTAFNNFAGTWTAHYGFHHISAFNLPAGITGAPDDETLTGNISGHCAGIYLYVAVPIPGSTCYLRSLSGGGGVLYFTFDTSVKTTLMRIGTTTALSNPLYFRRSIDTVSCRLFFLWNRG